MRENNGEFRERSSNFRNNKPRRFNSDDSGPREMHNATCSDCGAECQVPFKPSEGKPVYCRECYSSHKPKRF